MIQQKHNFGVLLALDDETAYEDDEMEDEGWKQFMDRFDLSKK